MTIIYRTDGLWGVGQGANLSPAQVDGNFYDIDTRVTYLEDNPTPAITPVSATMSGSAFTLGFSDGQQYTITWSVPMPRWRGNWGSSTQYYEMDFFIAPDGGFGAVTTDHISGLTFDWAATTGSPPVAVYRELVAPDGTVQGIDNLINVSISSVADGDMLVYNASSEFWVNTTPANVTLNLSAFVGDTGSGGEKGLVPAPEAGDAAAGKYLDASGEWSIPPGGGSPGGGASSLAGLLDVSIAGPSNDSLLQYKAATGKWTNVPLSAIGGTVTSVATGTGLTGGPITGSGTVSLASVVNNRLLTNISGTTAAPIANTLTATLDAIAGSARGSVLRRDATGWNAIGPGSAGQYLKSGGSGADVSWDSPAGTGTVTEVDTGTGLTGGPITGSGTLALDSIADKRLLANISGGSAAPIANTLTAILDSIIGGNRGQIVYRGAATWLALDPGTAGWFLKTQGTGADPVWSNVKGGGSGGAVGTSATVWNLAADLATIAALPSNTYSNGTAGVGATLTATANGALSIDGTAVSVADRVLVKDESNLARNGIYAVTATGGGSPTTHYVLTRVTDFDQSSEILDGSAVYVSGGSANANTAWVQVTGGGITLGTTSIEFEAISAPMPVCAEGEVLGNPQTYAAPASPTDLARMLRASLGDGTAGDVLTSTGTGSDPAWSSVTSGGVATVTKTADYTVTTDDNGVHFNNIGASGDIVLSLPAAAAGLRFGAAIYAAHYVKFLANGTEQIAIGTDNSAAGGYVRSNSAFSLVVIEAHGTEQWVASTMTGSWGIDA